MHSASPANRQGFMNWHTLFISTYIKSIFRLSLLTSSWLFHLSSDSHYFWMFCVVFIWGGLCGFLLLAMSGHLFDWGIKLIVKLWIRRWQCIFFLNTNIQQLVFISERDMSSDSGSGCVGTRLWRQQHEQTTRHINICSHLKYHWWRWN